MVDNLNENSIDNHNSISMVRHKIVFIGDISVGKTAIISRFTEDVFKENYDVF